MPVSVPQEGAFALAFKSTKYPGQLVATRRGSPLLVGIKTKSNLVSDHIPIIFGSKGNLRATTLPSPSDHSFHHDHQHVIMTHSHSPLYTFPPQTPFPRSPEVFSSTPSLVPRESECLCSHRTWSTCACGLPHASCRREWQGPSLCIDDGVQAFC